MPVNEPSTSQISASRLSRKGLARLHDVVCQFAVEHVGEPGEQAEFCRSCDRADGQVVVLLGQGTFLAGSDALAGLCFWWVRRRLT
ncbi:MAG: hypothetical protein ACM3ML_09570 [Micromonosporaceae bacterium]